MDQAVGMTRATAVAHMMIDPADTVTEVDSATETAAVAPTSSPFVVAENIVTTTGLRTTTIENVDTRAGMKIRASCDATEPLLETGVQPSRHANTLHRLPRSARPAALLYWKARVFVCSSVRHALLATGRLLPGLARVCSRRKTCQIRKAMDDQSSGKVGGKHY
ncbi:hypothetical protein F5B20DRAFT_389184 [Whalleya microplaca]|nr:hypothetical protein F5B20DRAFT_389184 [Whalleya microplaca]